MTSSKAPFESKHVHKRSQASSAYAGYRKFFSDELQQFHLVRKLPSGVNANDLRRRPILHNIRVVEAVGERETSHTRSMVRNEANSEELVITTKAPMVETITGHGTYMVKTKKDMYILTLRQS